MSDMESGQLARALLLYRAFCTRVCRARKPQADQIWYAETCRRGGAGINSEGGKARSKRRKGLILPVFASSLFIAWKRTLARSRRIRCRHSLLADIHVQA